MIGNKNCFYGKKHSDKTLKLLSELHSGNNNPMYGRHHSEESKRKNKESHLGKLLGEDNPRSKLTEDDVILIKMAFKELKDITQKEIAKLFNVHQTQVSKIKLGKIWSHIKLKGLYNE
jgi:DNA-directed RNA polymerase specialized sigma subunit